MKRAKILFTWQKNKNVAVDFQVGFFKEILLGGRWEFYFLPAIIFCKWTIPKLGEDFDYETKYRGVKIFLLGEYYIQIETVTRIFANNGA